MKRNEIRDTKMQTMELLLTARVNNLKIESISVCQQQLSAIRNAFQPVKPNVVPIVPVLCSLKQQYMEKLYSTCTSQQSAVATL